MGYSLGFNWDWRWTQANALIVNQCSGAILNRLCETERVIVEGVERIWVRIEFRWCLYNNK